MPLIEVVGTVTFLLATQIGNRSVVIVATSQASPTTAAPWTFAILTIDPFTNETLSAHTSVELLASTTVCNQSVSRAGSVMCPYINRCDASLELDALICAVAMPLVDHTLLVSLPLSGLAKDSELEGAVDLLELPDGSNVTSMAFDVPSSCVMLSMAPTNETLSVHTSVELLASTTVCNQSVSGTAGSIMCPYINRCDASSALGVLVCAVAMPVVDHTLLVALPLLDLVTSSTSVLSTPSLLELPDGSNVTSMAFDVPNSCVMLAMAPLFPTTATSVCRVQVLMDVGTASGLHLVSQLPMILSEATYPVIKTIVSESSTRSLYAVLLSSSDTLGTLFSIQQMSLFGIKIVTPNVVDRIGGTTVTLTGTGFVSSPQPLCVFTDDNGATAMSNGTVLNSTVLHCVAPASDVQDSICNVATVNLRYVERKTTTTLVQMKRPMSAALYSAVTERSSTVRINARSLQLTPTLITVVGYGFVQQDNTARCRHESSDGTAVYFVANATYVNTSLVLCQQPPGVTPTPPSSVLRYSHDGFVYSTENVLFAVVGTFSRVRVSVVADISAANGVVLVAAALTAVPPVKLETLDHLGNVIGAYDDTALQARCSLTSPETARDLTAVEHGILDQASLSATTSSGVAYFDNLVLVMPAAGPLVFYCYAVTNITSVGTASFTVVTGPPHSIVMLSPSTTWLSGVLSSVTLDPSPTLAVADVAGNLISNRSALPLSIGLVYTNTLPVGDLSDPTPADTVVRISASITEDNTYAFSGVSVRSPFGRQVQLRFSASGVPIAATLQLEQARCTASEYANAGRFTCSPCPANAICDGSASVVAEPGYWRSSPGSVVMYECTPADSCSATAACSPGYVGAVCGSCADGYGTSGTGCARCSSSAANWAVTMTIVVALGVLVYVLSVHTVVFTAVEDLAAGLAKELHEDSSIVSVVAKLVISHLQTLALIPARSLRLPQWVMDFLIRTPSFKPNVSYVACAVGSSPYSQMASQLVLVPLLLAGLGAAAFARAFLAHRRYLREAPNALAQMRYQTAQAVALSSRVRFRDVDHAAIAIAMPGSLSAQRAVQNAHMDLLEWYDGDVPDGVPRSAPLPRAPSLYVRTANLCAVVVIVVLFFVYPTLVQTSMQALQCRDIDAGSGGGSYRVLTVDPKTRCSDGDPDYVATRTLAVLVVVFVGAGVLLVAPGIVVLVNAATCGGNMAHTRQLFFFATGGYRLWYWESVAMGRKAAVALALVLAGAGQQQFIAGMWVCGAVALVTTMWRPWSHALCARLDAFGQVSLTLTFMFLGLAYTSSIAESDARLTFILVLVLIINIAFLLYAVQATWEALHIHLRHEAKSSRAAEELLDQFEGRAHPIMQRKIEDLRQKLQDTQVTAAIRGVPPFRELLLKEATLQRHDDTAACSPHTRSVYGSIYDTEMLQRRASIVPGDELRLPSFGGSNGSPKRSTTDGTSPIHSKLPRRKSVDSDGEELSLASSPVVAFRVTNRTDQQISLSESGADGWALRSTKSILLESVALAASHGSRREAPIEEMIVVDADDSDVERLHVAPLPAPRDGGGMERAPPPRMIAPGDGVGKSTPAVRVVEMTAVHAYQSCSFEAEDAPTALVGMSDAADVDAEATTASLSAEVAASAVAAALAKLNSTMVRRDSVVDVVDNVDVEGLSTLLPALTLSGMIPTGADFGDEDVAYFLAEIDVPADLTDIDLAEVEPPAGFLPIDVDFVSMDQFLDYTCNPRHVLGSGGNDDAAAAASTASAVVPPQSSPAVVPTVFPALVKLNAIPQRLRHVDGHDEVLSDMSGDFDDLIAPQNSSAPQHDKEEDNRRRYALTLENSAFGPCHASRAAWDDDKDDEDAIVVFPASSTVTSRRRSDGCDSIYPSTPSSNMITTPVRGNVATSTGILVSSKIPQGVAQLAIGRRRHRSGGGSESNLQMSLSATFVASPTSGRYRRASNTSTGDAQLLVEVLRDLQTAYSTLPQIPPPPLESIGMELSSSINGRTLSLGNILRVRIIASAWPKPQ
ncbi:transmembrane protein, putative [Bodo saltans]|uniref:Transmembrane protein, putative n=1 Tax=Bodo saltans TaxID=75058 RepID=A0A0S4IJ03_BODSA|nr:transmembrane protein, putative [Bodo saltans]|eukprot:CUE73911.1 transmembrane protein, putative [Bodo saltans]